MRSHDDDLPIRRSEGAGPAPDAVYRVDASHPSRASRWFRRTSRSSATARLRESTATPDGRSAPPPPQVVLSPYGGVNARLDRWLARDRSRRACDPVLDLPGAAPSPFERVIDQWLESDELRRAELEKLADLVLYGQQLRRRILFLSLARELDIPRILMGTCLVAREHARVVMIDADVRRQTLSVLLQRQHETGWHEILLGDLAPDDALLPLHTRGAALIAAGRSTTCLNTAPPATLADWEPAAAVLIDGGQWPVPHLPALLTASDHVFAVVRVDETRWSDFHHLRGALEAQGRRLDGCLVAGDFE